MATRRRPLGLALVAGILLVSAATATATAKPLEREKYSWTDAGSWSDCGPTYMFEAYGSGQFSLKLHGNNPTPYLTDNYSWHWLNWNPANGKFFTEDGNGQYKDVKIRHVEGTIYHFTAQETGRPYTITDMNGKVVLADRGNLTFEFEVDTQGDADLDNDVLVTDFGLVKDAGKHPIFYQSLDEYCALVNQLLG